jgi:hypothetical protein
MKRHRDDYVPTFSNSAKDREVMREYCKEVEKVLPIFFKSTGISYTISHSNSLQARRNRD